MPLVTLRDVRADDVPYLHALHVDEASARLAAVPARDAESFRALWAKILADPTTRRRMILAEGEPAGYALVFARDGHRDVGYWIARERWGQGIATEALRLLLEEETGRPLHATVAAHNRASMRVLERNGFRRVGEKEGADGVGIVEFELR